MKENAQLRHLLPDTYIFRPTERTLSKKRMSYSKFISWYATKLQTHPLTTKGITSGLIASAGDVTCQYITQRRKFSRGGPRGGDEGFHGKMPLSFSFQLDWVRTSRFTFLGFALIAPVVHVSSIKYQVPSGFRLLNII